MLGGTQDRIDDVLTVTHSDLYSIVASLLSELYQHNIEREEQPNIWELLASRLKLCRQFEGWRHNLDHRLKLVTPQEASTIFTVQSSDARFRLSLTMHYYRVLIMLNGPVLSQLLDLAVNHATTDDDLQSLFEQCVPVLTNNFGVLKSLHQILCVTARAENFLNQNNAWWLSNHAGNPPCYVLQQDGMTDNAQDRYWLCICSVLHYSLRFTLHLRP